MDHEGAIQAVLDEIDRKITENIRVEELAREATTPSTTSAGFFWTVQG